MVIVGLIMKSNKGSVSIEALIVVTTLILMMTFLFQMIVMFPKEDLRTQIVYDALNDLEHHHYIYNKVGFLELDFTVGHEDIDRILHLMQTDLSHLAESEYLSIVFKSKMLNQDMVVDHFELVDDQVLGEVSYMRPFMFGIKRTFTIKFDKRMWLFGNEPSLYPNKTLAEVVGNQNNKEESITVYQTKTGGKYHLKGCFYLVRSTTDHPKIISMTLDKAKNILHLEPCLRCIKGEVWKSTNK